MTEEELETFKAAVQVALGQLHNAGGSHQPLNEASVVLVDVVHAVTRDYLKDTLSGDGYARA